MNSIENILCEFNTFQDVVSDSEDIKDNVRDPLDGLGGCNEEKFYKLDQIVFADPLESINNDLDSKIGDTKSQKFSFFKKVTVEKKIGKRNKYHIAIEDTAKPVCPETNCKRRFSSVTLLKAHVRKVHCAERCFTCEVCGSTFSAKYLLERHMAVHEKKKIQCPVCCKMLSKRTNLSTHLRFVHRQGALECDKCGQRFVKRIQLTRHKSSHKI